MFSSFFSSSASKSLAVSNPGYPYGDYEDDLDLYASSVVPNQLEQARSEIFCQNSDLTKFKGIISKAKFTRDDLAELLAVSLKMERTDIANYLMLAQKVTLQEALTTALIRKDYPSIPYVLTEMVIAGIPIISYVSNLLEDPDSALKNPTGKAVLV